MTLRKREHGALRAGDIVKRRERDAEPKPAPTPKPDIKGPVIQQSNNPTPRGAMDRIKDAFGFNSPDYSPKTDPNYKPDTGPSDEDKAALDKKVKDAIKENYLHMLKRK